MFPTVADARKSADADESEKAGAPTKADFKACPCTRAKNPRVKIVPNPYKVSRADVAKATKLYEEFREQKADRGKVLQIDWPRSLMVMGYIHDIGYDTVRNGDAEKYRHHFAPGSRPYLCADKKGRLFIVAGRYHVTERGIVDLDGGGRELE